MNEYGLPLQVVKFCPRHYQKGPNLLQILPNMLKALVFFARTQWTTEESQALLLDERKSTFAIG